MHGARSVVVGIEEISVFGNGVAITGFPFFQDEGFEKPGRVGEMPFRGTDFGHRLQDAIFGREIFGQPCAEVSDLVKAREQISLRQRAFARARLRGRRFLFWSDRGLDQVIPPSCSSSSLRASSI